METRRFAHQIKTILSFESFFKHEESVISSKHTKHEQMACMCGVATHMCSHASAGLGKERWKENKDTCENHHTVVV